MLTIGDIRKYMGVWKQQTYRSGLEYCYAIKKDRQAYELTIEVLQLQNLNDKAMDGNSVQNIPIKNEGKVDILFSDIFWDIAGEYITPVYYVASIVKQCVERDITNSNQVAGIVGRGLRSFPSFLREMDLTYKISCFFPEAEITNGPEQDVGEHTDVLIKNGDTEYRLWSYQNFERGLTNTASRFYGRRRELPIGYHILCPIDIRNSVEVEEVDGWFFYSDRYVKYIYDMISIEKPDDYATVARLQEYAMKLYLKKANVVYKRE